MVEPAFCQHARTRLIAQDAHAKYVECVECGTIFEADEIHEPSGFDESLSDA